ncbi:MAG: DUF2341 domain-containing protein, partial [Chloroflexi bacterium]|nr:DUF2341 domain-containing protein [Chloroflexota bacterium]
MYYGNAGAASEQSPDSTFVFFDDFNTSSINTGKWDTGGATGFLQAGTKSLLNGITTSGRLLSQTAFSYPNVLEIKTRTSYRPDNGVMLGGFYSSGSKAFGILQNPTNDYYFNNGTWVSIGNVISEVQEGTTAWYKIMIEARTNLRTRYTTTNMSTGVTTRDELVFNGITGEKIALGTRYDNAYSGQPYSNSWDYVFVRKYAASTPSTSCGSAEGFESTGGLTSVVFDAGAGQTPEWKTISWTENVPRGANITVQTRAGNTAAPDGSWTTWSTASSYAAGTTIPSEQIGKRYIQYKVNFYSNGATLLDVTIWHTPLASWDTTAVPDALYTLRLSVTDTAGDWTDQHTARDGAFVNVDNTLPTVSITSPTEGAFLTNMVTTSGTANDARASIGNVEIKVDGGQWVIGNGTSRVNEDNAAASYTGIWTTYSAADPSDGTLKYDSTGGDSATFVFTGTSVSWVGTRGFDRGKANVSIDGGPAVEVDLYNPADLFQEIVFSEGGLTAGPHTLTITVAGTANPSSEGTRVDVDAFDVGGDVSWTYDWVTNTIGDGPHTFAVRATDRAGNASNTATKNVTTDNTDPTSAITAPAANAAFTTDTPVNGTAKDTNFDHYLLQYGYGTTPAEWVDIGSYSPPAPGIDNSNLGTWPAPARTPLYEWPAAGDTEDWSPVQQVSNITVNNGAISGTTTGTDGYIKTSPVLTINGNDIKVLRLRMKVSNATGVARLYWKYSYPYYSQYLTVPNIWLPLGEKVTSTNEYEWGEPATSSGQSNFGNISRRMIDWPLQSAGQWVDYKIDMNTGRIWANGTLIADYRQGTQGWPNAGFWAGTIYQLRFDPSETSGTAFDIDYLAVEGADGNYTIKLNTYDRVGRSSQASVSPVLIDRNNPACSIESPVNMTFLGSGNFTASGKSVDDPINGVASGVATVQLRTILNVDSFAPTEGPWENATGTTSWTKAVSLPAGWHGIQARAIDRAGNIQNSNYVYITVDNEPPPVPRLRAMPDKNRGGILLSWTPVKDSGSGVDYYILYRGNTPVTTGLLYPDGTNISDADSELVTRDFGNGPETYRAFHAANAIDTSYTPNTTVKYYIRAVDNVGNYSAKASISVVYDTQAPTDPSNLSVGTAGVTDTALLQWNPSTDNQAVAEYRIYRDIVPSFVPSADKLIGTATVTGTFFTTKFVDPSLTWNKTFYYKVVAYDDSMNPSSPSNEAQVTIGVEQSFESELPHKTFSQNPDQCVLCHRTHTGPGSSLLKKEQESETCFTCHDGTGSNSPTKAEFDYSPSGLHRVKDQMWPNGSLSCIDCHNPHLNTEKASFDNFDDLPIGTQPSNWTYPNGAWAASGDATHVELRQSNTTGATMTVKDTTIDIQAKGGYFSTQVKFVSGDEAFFTVASDGLTPRSGVTIGLNKTTGKMELRDGDTLLRSEDVTLNTSDLYRIKIRLDADRNLEVKLYKVVKGDLSTGHDTITDQYITGFKYQIDTGHYKGTYIALGTVDAAADFDIVRVNYPGMLQNRYRKFYKGTVSQDYIVPEDRVMTEAFCLACHGTSADSPGGSQLQYYQSVHNPEIGGTAGQALDQDSTSQVKPNPTTLTPRWQEIRNEWRQIKQSSVGSRLSGTSNACLYCHGYHGQQFYERTQGGEEQLCYTCHGGTLSYSRDGRNIKNEYQRTSKHGLNLADASIKCTSCHGQRAMTDRHTYEGYTTSIITNPANIKQYWSDMRTQGKTINDYCNTCHKEADRKGRVLIETHSSSKIIPYTIKYPPLITTN